MHKLSDTPRRHHVDFDRQHGDVVARSTTPHGTVEIRQQDKLVWIHIDDSPVQSAVYLENPTELLLPYLPRMMAFMLFNSQPKKILMLGLGGGALLRFLGRYVPHAHIDVIEINARLVTLARQFLLAPEESAKVTVTISDANEWIRSAAPSTYDVVLVDLFETSAMPNFTETARFYAECRRVTTPTGVAVFNLAVHSENEFLSKMNTLRRVFQRNTLSMPVAGHTNCVSLAFKSLPASITIPQIVAQSQQLAAQIPLNFPLFARELAGTNPHNGDILLGN